MLNDYDSSKVTPYGEVHAVGDMIMQFYYDENHKLKAIFVTDAEGAERSVKLLKEGIKRVKQFRKKNGKINKLDRLS